MTEPAPVPEQITLRIISPEEILFERQVRWLQVPLADGLLGIWPGHAPLVAALVQGDLLFDEVGGERTFAVEGGVLCIAPDECTILVGLPAARSKPSAVDREKLFSDLEESLSDLLSEQQVRELQGE